MGMRLHQAVPIAFVCLLLVPGGSSQATEASRELLVVDAAGDVTYGAAHGESRDRHYVDLESAWFEFAELEDTLALVVQFHDTTSFDAREQGWVFRCEFAAEAFEENDHVGQLIYSWEAVGGHERVVTDVKLVTVNAGAGTFAHYSVIERFAHTFDLELAPQGRVTFITARAPIVLLTNELRAPHVYCSEWFDPAYGNPLLWSNLYDTPLAVHDNATNERSFTVSKLEPLSQPTAAEPWELGNWAAPTIGAVIIAKILLGWYLYARIHRHDVLKQPVRAALYERIQHNPGIRQRQLLRLSGIATGALAHHLRTLEKNGLIRKVPFHGFSGYFTSDIRTKDAGRTMALQTSAARELYEEIQKNPGITAARLAETRNVHASSVLYHIKRLVEAGIVARTRTRAGLELRATDSSLMTSTSSLPAASEPTTG